MQNHTFTMQMNIAMMSRKVMCMCTGASYLHVPISSDRLLSKRSM